MRLIFLRLIYLTVTLYNKRLLFVKHNLTFVFSGLIFFTFLGLLVGWLVASPRNASCGVPESCGSIPILDGRSPYLPISLGLLP